LKILSFLTRAEVTATAVYDGSDELFHDILRHDPSELCALAMPEEQGRHRFNAILEAASGGKLSLGDVGIVITFTISLNLPPGIYMAEERLLRKISSNVIDENQYRSGAFAAYFLSSHIGDNYGTECLPLVVVPAIRNEISPEAALSGLRGVTRDPIYNNLSQRVGVFLCARHELHRKANETRMVVAHLSGEISVGAHDMGLIIDSNGPKSGEGPLSPKSSGFLPVDALIELCYSGKYDMDEMLNMVSEQSGLSAYLDNTSLKNVMEKYRAGDKKTVFLVKVMAYQTAREIGARAAALNGKTEMIVLAGRWATFTELADEIASYVDWIAPVKIHGTETRLRRLAEIAATVYKGDFKILLYGIDRN
jgi:butyrate kinase